MAETNNYIEAIGRRKQAIARVRLHNGGSGKVTMNERKLEEHLPLATLQESVMSPIVETGTDGMFDITIRVTGGGIR